MRGKSKSGANEAPKGDAEGVEWEEYIPIRLEGLGGASWAGSGARRKTNLVHSDACRRLLVAKIHEILHYELQCKNCHIYLYLYTHIIHIHIHIKFKTRVKNSKSEQWKTHSSLWYVQSCKSSRLCKYINTEKYVSGTSQKYEMKWQGSSMRKGCPITIWLGVWGVLWAPHPVRGRATAQNEFGAFWRL